MNKIFKTKYNRFTNTSVVTSELSRNKGKSGLIKTALATAIASLGVQSVGIAAEADNNVYDALSNGVYIAKEQDKTFTQEEASKITHQLATYQGKNRQITIDGNYKVGADGSNTQLQNQADAFGVILKQANLTVNGKLESDAKSTVFLESDNNMAPNTLKVTGDVINTGISNDQYDPDQHEGQYNQADANYKKVMQKLNTVTVGGKVDIKNQNVLKFSDMTRYTVGGDLTVDQTAINAKTNPNAEVALLDGYNVVLKSDMFNEDANVTTGNVKGNVDVKIGKDNTVLVGTGNNKFEKEFKVTQLAGEKGADAKTFKGEGNAVTYMGTGVSMAHYDANKIDITATNKDAAGLALNLDSVGYRKYNANETGGIDTSSTNFDFGMTMNGGASNAGKTGEGRHVTVNLDSASSIKAQGENGTAVKVLNEFKQDNYPSDFMAKSDAEKAEWIKKNVVNFYTGVDINNKGTISSEKGDAIDVSAFNRKDIYEKALEYRSEWDATLNNIGAHVTNGGTISAKEDGGAFIGSDHNDSFESQNGKIEGNIYLGKGNDTLTLKGTDITKVKLLEGSYKGNPDALDKTESNTLILNQELTGNSEGQGTYEDKAIRNFKRIVVGEGEGNTGTLNVTGNMVSKSGTIGDLEIGKGSTLNIVAPKDGKPADIRLDYNVKNNGGLIDMSKNDTPNDVVTIGGNYTDNNGELRVNTFWNNPDVQQVDKLVVKGNHEGNTNVKAFYKGKEGIFGDVTRGDLEKNGELKAPVVEVKGEEKGTFSGSAQTTNAGEAQLVKHGNNYHWTLTAREKPPVEEPKPQPEPPKPVPPVEEPKPQPEPPKPQPQPEQPKPQPPVEDGPLILAEPVPGYVQTQRVAGQMLMQETGKLQERMGDLQTPSTDPQSWARIGGGFTQEQGKDRLGYKSKSGFVQIGTDLSVDRRDNAVRRSGVMLSYGRADNKFYDKYHAKDGYIIADKFTGKGRLETANFGLYSTWYGDNGLYVDTTGHVGWIGAEYTANNGVKAKNSGLSLMANAEIGKEYQISDDGKWNFVPEAQLTLLNTQMSGFNDGIREVKSTNHTTLRGRVGLGVTFNDEKGKNSDSFFASANLVHDFMGSKTELDVGRDRIVERYAPTFGELSVGGNLPLTQNLSAYANVNYTRALSKTNTIFSGSGKEAYNGRVGLKYVW